MKIKVSILSGIALDWAVAKCEGREVKVTKQGEILYKNPAYLEVLSTYSPSSDWSQGGPIIEREKIELYANGNYDKGGMLQQGYWSALIPNMFKENYLDGPTPLIAAMRCYVASKMGEEVDIPDAILGVDNA